ncbi:dihydroorotate dehydrogenase electron transfer subunit [Chloroflexota bacterium]
MKQVVASVVSLYILPSNPYSSHGRTISNILIIGLNCPGFQNAKPGQFVMVRCGKESLLPRPFTIHQLKNDNISLYLGVWKDGQGTNWLLQRKVGDAVEVFGPLGNGFSIHQNSQNLLLVAGGIGIAPLHFLAQEALSKGHSVTILFGAQGKTQLYPENFLPSGIKVVAATDDGTIGHHGLVTDLLPEFADWADQIFACGPVPMYKTMAQMPELKNKSVQISLEVRMGCGRGVCYGCTLKTRSGLKKVCEDGPVFDLGDILWDELSL